MKKVLVFTGAGMSVPLGLPSTKDFMKEVLSGADRVTTHTVKYLGSSGDDIEWLLSTLANFHNETPFTEFLLPKIAEGNADLGARLQAFQHGLSRFKLQAANEITRIKKIIFDKLGQYDSGQALSLYLNMVKEIKTVFGDAAISIITTNYDLAFESAFEAVDGAWSKLGVADVDFGFSIQFGRPIYNASQDFGWSKSTIEYLKIHGSVDWHRDGRGRCSRSMSSTIPDDPDQMAILYPGFKGVPESEPFISMHGRLSTRLYEADEIIVIGFAFRDAYINNIFENVIRIRPDVQVMYFNPIGLDAFPEDSYVPHLIKNYSSFRHVQRGVGIDENSLGLEELIKSRLT